MQAIVRKEGLKTDPETQTLEDVACLAFLERGFAEFAVQHDDEKVIGMGLIPLAQAERRRSADSTSN